MRLDLIAMKDEILMADLNQAHANFARVLKLASFIAYSVLHTYWESLYLYPC